MRTTKYSVIFKKEIEGGFTAIVPSLPGCVSYGKTMEEAQAMIIDAIGGYVKSLEKHHESVPRDESLFLTVMDLPINPCYA